MEACGTAHYWGRRCQARGLAVRLLPVQYVRPYVRRNKSDRTDTEAMLEADRCAGVQPVPVKTVDQQALQALHRVRTQLTPRESTTGTRRYLGRISKRGDGYLRCLLTHGARAVLLAAQRTARTSPHRLTRLQHWAVTLAARRGHNKAAIALANKLARIIIWALWCHEADFHSPTVQTTAA